MINKLSIQFCSQNNKIATAIKIEFSKWDFTNLMFAFYCLIHFKYVKKYLLFLNGMFNIDCQKMNIINFAVLHGMSV